MGRGNIRTTGKYEDVYYVDYENFYLAVRDDDGNKTEEMAFDQEYMDRVLEYFRDIMVERTSFTKCNRWANKECEIILENSLFEIGIADNGWSFVVMLLQKQDAPLGLQAKHYKGYLNTIKEALFEHFEEIGEWGSTWVSTKISREAPCAGTCSSHGPSKKEG